MACARDIGEDNMVAVDIGGIAGLKYRWKYNVLSGFNNTNFFATTIMSHFDKSR